MKERSLAWGDSWKIATEVNGCCGVGGLCWETEKKNPKPYTLNPVNGKHKCVCGMLNLHICYCGVGGVLQCVAVCRVCDILNLHMQLRSALNVGMASTNVRVACYVDSKCHTHICACHSHI